MAMTSLRPGEISESELRLPLPLPAVPAIGGVLQPDEVSGPERRSPPPPPPPAASALRAREKSGPERELQQSVLLLPLAVPAMGLVRPGEISGPHCRSPPQSSPPMQLQQPLAPSMGAPRPREISEPDRRSPPPPPQLREGGSMTGLGVSTGVRAGAGARAETTAAVLLQPPEPGAQRGGERNSGAGGGPEGGLPPPEISGVPRGSTEGTRAGVGGRSPPPLSRQTPQNSEIGEGSGVGRSAGGALGGGVPAAMRDEFICPITQV